ncbi:MAG: VWA domain-containing protein, partial [Candidatus Kapabacteria bacterium]|nr:VWA domain-containing protein [Candidatus Kapabacteria bacterium]
MCDTFVVLMRTVVVTMSMAFMIPILVSAQTCTLLDVDSSAFPTLRARIMAFDAQGRKQQLQAPDVRLLVNGVRQVIQEVLCGDTVAPQPVSAVLVVDASVSMSGGHLAMAQAAARAWINAPLANDGECAIVRVGDGVFVDQDLTKDRQRLLAAVDAFAVRGPMDHQQALLHPIVGGLAVGAAGNGKRIVVMITDGVPDRMDVDDVVAEAERLNCSIGVIVLGVDAPDSFREIARRTGGSVHDRIESIEHAVLASRLILHASANVVPCTVSWQYMPQCAAQQNVIDVLWQGDTSRTVHAADQARQARLEFTPYKFSFPNPRLGETIRRTVVVTARNATFTVDNVSSSDKAFSIAPRTFQLADGEQIELTVTYRVLDSTLRHCEFAFQNDICTQSFYAHGGFYENVASGQKLRVTHPNGGERFGVGNDIEIRWEGASADDSMQIDVSTDNGTTWTPITKRATGGRYTWRNARIGRDTTVFVRVANGDYPIGFDPQKPSPQIVWEKAIRFHDKQTAGYDILQMNDDAFAVCGRIEHDYGYKFLVFGYDHIRDSIPWMCYASCASEGSNQAKGLIMESNGMICAVGEAYCEVDVEYGHFSKVKSLGSQSAWMTVNPRTGKIESFYDGGDERDQRLDAICVKMDGKIASAGTFYIDKSRGNDICAGRCFGGSNFEHATSIMESADGAIVVAGGTRSNDGDVIGHHGELDAWVIKTNPNDYSVIWQRPLGGSDADEARSVIELRDGSYVVAGWTASSDGDVKVTKGKEDAWVVKLDGATGNIIWQRTYGGSNTDFAQCIIQDDDGNLVLVGRTLSSDGDVLGYSGGGDCWFMKLSSDDGAILS